MARNSVAFPLTTSNATVASAAFLDALATFSVSYWIKTSVSTAFRWAMNKSDASQNLGWSHWTSNGTDPGGPGPILQINNSGTNYRADCDAGLIYDGAWHNVVMTYDSVAGAVFYIDGSVHAKHTYNTPLSTLTNIGVFTFGSSFGQACNQGPYAGMQMWSSVLTAGNATTLAAGGEVATNLIGQWYFTEGSGLTSTDTVASRVLTFSAVTWSTDIPTQLTLPGGSHRMLTGAGN